METWEMSFREGRWTAFRYTDDNPHVPLGCGPHATLDEALAVVVQQTGGSVGFKLVTTSREEREKNRDWMLPDGSARPAAPPDDRARIAANLAKALGVNIGFGRHDLMEDGSNVFDDPWRWLALEWLLMQNAWVLFDPPVDPSNSYHEVGFVGKRVRDSLRMECPAAEFPARAIDQLMEGKE